MGDCIKESHRLKVDQALSFLGRDCSEFEYTTNELMLAELTGVIDGLLTSLSQTISCAAQHTFKVSDTLERKLAYDSIMQKSIELLVD